MNASSPNGQPHVLFIPSWYPTPEAPIQGVFFAEQARALHRAGARVGVIAPEVVSVRALPRLVPNVSAFRGAVEDGIPTFRRRLVRPPRLPRLLPRRFVHAADQLMRAYVSSYGVPDVLHAQCAAWGGHATRSLAASYRLPYVVTEHASAYALGTYRAWQLGLIERVFADAAEVFAVSTTLAKDMQRQAGAKRVSIVPNMVNTELFTVRSLRLPRPSFRFLSIAMLTPNKGMDTLIRAFAQAFPDDDDVTLDIGGDGTERRLLEDLAYSLNVAEKVRFLGALSRTHVPEAMASADCFVLASRVETFGVVFIEALATGVPVIATRSGGPEDFVDERVGALVAPDDVPNLAAALRRMRDEAGSYAPADLRAHVAERFSPAVIAQSLLDAYRMALRS